MWQKPLAACSPPLLRPYEQRSNEHKSREWVMSAQSQVRLLSSDVVKTHRSLDGIRELISQSCGSWEVHQGADKVSFIPRQPHLTVRSQDLCVRGGREGKDGETERERLHETCDISSGH